MAKFVIKQAKDGEFRFNLKADNGQIILLSEKYISLSTCISGIISIQNNCADYGNYERKVTLNKKHFFVLKASNGKVIVKSELYDDETEMENGISSIKKNGTTKNVGEELFNYLI